jgi:hypothetical protein
MLLGFGDEQTRRKNVRFLASLSLDECESDRKFVARLADLFGTGGWSGNLRQRSKEAGHRPGGHCGWTGLFSVH